MSCGQKKRVYANVIHTYEYVIHTTVNILKVINNTNEYKLHVNADILNLSPYIMHVTKV